MTNLRRIDFNSPFREDPKVREAVQLLEKLLNDNDFSFAYDFLSSVYEFWEEHGRLTEKQIQAIHNVAATDPPDCPIEYYDDPC